MELLLLDRNSAFADIDLDAGGLLTLLVEHITEHAANDDEHADEEVQNVAIHVLVPIAGRSNRPQSLKTTSDHANARIGRAAPGRN